MSYVADWEENDENDDDIEDDIDNSNLSFRDSNICIKLNTNEAKNYRLKLSEKTLYKKFPKFKEAFPENTMQSILEEVFPFGFLKHLYIRNLSFKNKNGCEVRLLGIRPERTEGDFLKDYLPDDVSLLFKGRIGGGGKEFVVDSVYDVVDTEKLDFEVDVNAIPFNNSERIHANFLFDVLDRATSLTEYTMKRLEEWKEYLRWKQELANRQIYGCKYYKIEFDEKKKRLNFYLVFEGEQEFEVFKKYLGRDIQVFDNNYSKDRWKFEFIGEFNDRKQYFKSVEIGKYRGVIDQYYLENNDSKDEKTQKNIYMDDNNGKFGNYLKKDNDIPLKGNINDNVLENNIYDHFERPYIVQVAYDLNRRDADEIAQLNLDESEVDQYIRENIIENYNSDGFLALSSIGEFVLIRRFQQAIENLEKDECSCPNLAMWLFDISRARNPDECGEIKIDKWLNDKIEKNENQKEAVRKMLMAPDLCLVQGPPGTGKTTVIAEAIYQFVKQGYRVLVASQSNDAVDNALERLAESPEIRAVRLGQKSKRKRKIEDLSTKKFGEDDALKYYYHALSSQVSKTWLDTWASLEKGGIQYDADIRDATLFNQDIASLNAELTKLNDVREKLNENLNALNEQFIKANDNNTKIEEDKVQYRLAVECFKGKSDLKFYLSKSLLEIFERNVNELAEKSIALGVYITPNKLEIDIMGLEKEQFYVNLISNNLKSLRNICDKIAQKRGGEASNNAEVLSLEQDLFEAKEKHYNCITNEDEEGEAIYKKKIKELSKRLDQLKFSSSIVTFTESERAIITNKIIKDIEGGNLDEWFKEFSELLKAWYNSISNAFACIKKEILNSKPIDVSEISREIEKTNSKRFLNDDEINKIKVRINSKKQTLGKLREKYKLDSTDVNNIISHISEIKEKNIETLEKQKDFRNTWEKTLRLFKERLDDNEAFKYDKEYYQQIYINACNVVGISCTDNMRNLSDNGYMDFDVVIIDEVSKATPPELLIPLMKARKAILVGDHRQLPPMFKEQETSYKELIENQENIPDEIKNLLTEENFRRFQKMVSASLFKDYFEMADSSIKHSLFVQYRMHRNIMDIINRFYEQRLECGYSFEVEELEKKHNLTIKGIDGSTFIVPERHAYWIDSSFIPSNKPIFEVRPNNSTSNYNVLEKYIVIELLKKIAIEYKDQGYNKEKQKTVGVISFYQMQVNEMREAFREAKKNCDFSAIDVDINTVDRFQGKEKNIIITSLVRNNKQGRASKHIVAFERINVAFSRAQELLIIVGARSMYEYQSIQLPNMNKVGFRTTPVYKNIIEELHRKGCFKSCNKIITPEIEKSIIKEYVEIGGKL